MDRCPQIEIGEGGQLQGSPSSCYCSTKLIRGYRLTNPFHRTRSGVPLSYAAPFDKLSYLRVEKIGTTLLKILNLSFIYTHRISEVLVAHKHKMLSLHSTYGR